MAIDHEGDVPLPHFEDRLWTELSRLHAGNGSHEDPPAVPASPSRERRSAAGALPVRHGMRARRSLLAGVAAAAAALVAAVAVTGPAADDRTTAGVTPGTASAGDGEVTPVSLEARIVAATEEALADSVVHTVQDQLHGPGGDSEWWADERSGAFRSLSYHRDGMPAFDSGPAEAPGVDDTGPPPLPDGALPSDPSLPSALRRDVDHCFATYREYEDTLLPAYSEAGRVRDGLRDGTMIEDGTEVVDGRELIRIVSLVGVPADAADGPDAAAGPEGGEAGATTTVPAKAPDPPTGDQAEHGDEVAGAEADALEAAGAGAGGGRAGDVGDGPVIDTDHVALVDPETYRPVMLLGYPGSETEYVMTFEYLPRTPANLALLSPPVPDGFEQVASLPGDGERLERCGW